MNGYMHMAQKSIGGGSRSDKHQLLIGQAVTKDPKNRHTNLTMALIDYRGVYHSVPHSWILESLKLY